jgi:hypothetical protein
MQIIPIKYILIGISCLSVLTVSLIILLFKINKIWVKVLSLVYLLIEVVIIIITLVISSKTDNVIDKLTNTKYETISYSVITLKDSPSDISSYTNKNIGIIKDMEYTNEVEKEISKKVKVKVKYQDNYFLLI